jgi:hypothetical protein
MKRNTFIFSTMEKNGLNNSKRMTNPHKNEIVTRIKQIFYADN